MDSRLSTLIERYQARVRLAVELMTTSGIERPASNRAWSDLDIPQSGVLQGGGRYYKHGYGCAVHLPDGPVDFDFGPHGEIDGFDAWRLIGFAGARLREYGFSGEVELKTVFDETSQEHMVFSGYLLYFLSA